MMTLSSRRRTAAYLSLALAAFFLLMPGADAMAQQIAPLVDRAARDVGNVTLGLEKIAWNVGGLMIVIFAIVSVVSGRINWRIALMGLLALYVLANWRDLLDFLRGP